MTYGTRILVTVSRGLTPGFGQAFTLGARDCAIPFPQSFTDQEIVSAPSTQLSWGSCMEILPNKDPLARDFCEMRHIERWDVPTQGGISTDILAIEPEAERLLDRLLLKGTPS